jgi:hypothetical protein
MKNGNRTSTDDATLVVPVGLSRKGRKAALLILAFMRKHNLMTGGCNLFRTPTEWRDRGERYGTSSELVLVYDGGDMWSVMNSEYGYALHDELRLSLATIGCHIEPCTGWYGAVYN